MAGNHGEANHHHHPPPVSMIDHDDEESQDEGAEDVNSVVHPTVPATTAGTMGPDPCKAKCSSACHACEAPCNDDPTSADCTTCVATAHQI